MNKITLGLEGRVAESRGPREGPAREAGTQGRERAASGEVAAAEAWEFQADCVRLEPGRRAKRG